MPAAKQRQNARSETTRARLIAVAEQLFAERGVEGVSLSEINRASKQRNSNACQYHFGSKDGLLQAIVDKHVPGIAALRNQRIAALEAAGELTLESVVKAWVEPVADKLQDPDGGLHFIRVNAQLTSTHTLSLLKPDTATLRAEGAEQLARAFRLTLPQLPDAVREQRLQLAASLLFHGLADHSQLLENMSRQQVTADSILRDDPLFVLNLVDAIYALLAAPVSPEIQQRLQLLSP
ncbi:TetR/AcrR family transcriptional regulator [Parahaliea maris]|uniref:TetR/AcrR family transcriptional regulator n=1 Tax=Parahaliea maris TaxID=2716870 RepID=A0A5C8ZYL9_9GAMM|nr:TetR/AcrR family transcriptional regulator [Parahaliea maris]TXS92702.1 TetR/AcrR family transcriptional regulator [Parahaliea maris]